MKKLLLVPLFALALGGCVTTGGGGQVVINPTPPDPEGVIEVQQAIAQVCGIAVPAGKVVNVLIGLTGDQSVVVTADLVLRAVTAFCGALNPQQVRFVRVRYQHNLRRYQNLGDGLEYGG